MTTLFCAAGALGSVALTLLAGLRIGAPVVLDALFAVWVGFPFVVLAAALRVSRRRAMLVHRLLSRLVLIVSLGSVAVYAVAAIIPARPVVPVFVLVAPVSLLLVGVAVAGTVLFRGRHP